MLDKFGWVVFVHTYKSITVSSRTLSPITRLKRYGMIGELFLWPLIDGLRLRTADEPTMQRSGSQRRHNQER
jgi:hypothetical protein